MANRKQLEADLKDAIRARDELRKNTLRMILAAVQRAEVDQRGEVGEAEIGALLQKEAKARRETIADAEKAGRPDIAAGEQAELAVIESYLPRQLSRDEILALVKAAIAESGATDPRQMGQVMKLVGPQVKGQADGRMVSEIIRQQLSVSQESHYPTQRNPK